jgi:hypothetical protein
MTEKQEFLIVTSTAVIFTLLSLSMVVLGWILYSEQSELLSDGLEASGRIVGFERIGDRSRWVVRNAG